MQQTFIWGGELFSLAWIWKYSFFQALPEIVIYVFKWETRQTYIKIEMVAGRESGNRGKRKI